MIEIITYFLSLGPYRLFSNSY